MQTTVVLMKYWKHLEARSALQATKFIRVWRGLL